MAAFQLTVSVLVVVHALPRILLRGKDAAMQEGWSEGATCPLDMLPSDAKRARAYFSERKV